MIAVPTVALAGAVTEKWVAAPALTMIAADVPVTLLVAVSVAVIVWFPAVLRVTPAKVCTPLSPATKA